MISKIINASFSYVIRTSKIYNIDESHSLKHSMEVYNFAKDIYSSEVNHTPELVRQQSIIYSSAILHDMCDKKYVNETEGVANIRNLLVDYMSPEDITVVSSIITTMSYSKVMVKGFPNLENYQLAYHIVREADLLAAYDIDRCVLYGMNVEGLQFTSARDRAKILFTERVLNYKKNNLFITDYSKNKSLELHNRAVDVLNNM